MLRKIDVEREEKRNSHSVGLVGGGVGVGDLDLLSLDNVSGGTESQGGESLDGQSGVAGRARHNEGRCERV